MVKNALVTPLNGVSQLADKIARYSTFSDREQQRSHIANAEIIPSDRKSECDREFSDTESSYLIDKQFDNLDVFQAEEQELEDLLSSLGDLLKRPKFENVLSWSNAGRAFLIKNKSRFTQEVLPILMGHRNFPSFVRQMKGFGFKQLKRKEGPSFYLSGFKEKRKRNTAANKIIAAALEKQRQVAEFQMLGDVKCNDINASGHMQLQNESAQESKYPNVFSHQSLEDTKAGFEHQNNQNYKQMDTSVQIPGKFKKQAKPICKPQKAVKIERTTRIQRVSHQCDETLKKFEELDAKLKQMESSFEQQTFQHTDLQKQYQFSNTKDLQRKVGLLEKMSLFMGHNPVNICTYQTSCDQNQATPQKQSVVTSEATATQRLMSDFNMSNQEYQNQYFSDSTKQNDALHSRIIEMSSEIISILTKTESSASASVLVPSESGTEQMADQEIEQETEEHLVTQQHDKHISSHNSSDQNTHVNSWSHEDNTHTNEDDTEIAEVASPEPHLPAMWEALPSDFMLKEEEQYQMKPDHDNWIHDTYQSFIPNYGESCEDLVMSSYQLDSGLQCFADDAFLESPLMREFGFR
ncbi:hypothetical protein FGO68_gene2878 [Halteria grandinella]|uniref:HSF-type DNA-binding domain-containing protein n=1 Tax=Halteria grandinella TaxID=5974 RepID=A0A8J8NY96_HALGN|nr:hypothetical protein FGO68_gene2878 [Halteria grandinella]